MREAQHLGRDRLPFAAVGVEKLLPGAAGRDQGQFPAQVVHVGDPGVHPLAARRVWM